MLIYFQSKNNPRSYKNTFDTYEDVNKIQSRIDYVSKIPQAPQNSEEWYKYRYNRLTASDIYKALDTNSKKNELIFKKCKRLNLKKCNSVNTNSAMHWGHKYEPLSIMHYEFDFDTEVGEFGCKAHSKYPFLRASPDGINIDESRREIKKYCDLSISSLKIFGPVPETLLGLVNFIREREF